MKDLTKGFPAKVIILFAIPLMIRNIAQQLYNITDSKIVSLYVSSNSLAAVGVSLLVFSTKSYIEISEDNIVVLLMDDIGLGIYTFF